MSESKSRACALVRRMYDAINRRDLDGAIACVDDDCRYEDLNFPQPFVGKAAVRGLFAEFCEGMPGDLSFAIDELTKNKWVLSPALSGRIV